MYVSTKELKEVPKKTWLPKSDADRLERICAGADIKPSALIRKAVLLALARIEKEGYSALYKD